jgi:hypothetical protein
LHARTGMIVIPAQAGIHYTSSTAGSGQARTAKPRIEPRFAARWIPAFAGMTWPAFLRSLSEPGIANSHYTLDKTEETI